MEIKTLHQELAAALAQIQQLLKQALPKTPADLIMTTAVPEKTLDLHPSSAPSTRTNSTRTPPTSTPPSSPTQVFHDPIVKTTGALHPFFVAHFDNHITYNPQDFRQREYRLPLEILYLVDKAMAEAGDLGLDPDTFEDILGEDMNDIYEETQHLKFWYEEDALMELDRYMRTRYPQFNPN
jgi:hypothetical protein